MMPAVERFAAALLPRWPTCASARWGCGGRIILLHTVFAAQFSLFFSSQLSLFLTLSFSASITACSRFEVYSLNFNEVEVQHRFNGLLLPILLKKIAGVPCVCRIAGGERQPHGRRKDRP